MGLQLLEQIAWHSLTGPQAAVSTGTDRARRYAPGFSPIIAFADTQHPDFAALEPYCETGEHFYTSGWTGAAPAGWQVDAEQRLLKMVWEGAPPAADEGFAARPLANEHVPQMLELVALTKPGPFGPRTIELGDYVGCFEGPRLVAMAGERRLKRSWPTISSSATSVVAAPRRRATRSRARRPGRRSSPGR